MEIGTFLNDILIAVQLFFENVNLTELIQSHGSWFYAITFIWAFLEGETFVIFAGAAAAKGALNVYYLILAAWLGSFCGDQIYFLLGRRFGPWIRRKFPKMLPMIDKVSATIQKHDIPFILSYRYLYGVRNIASVAMGMSGINWARFAFWNFIAAFIWANSFAWAGYIFGEVLEKALGDTVEGLMIGLVVLLIIVFGGHYLVKKWQERKKV